MIACLLCGLLPHIFLSFNCKKIFRHYHLQRTTQLPALYLPVILLSNSSVRSTIHGRSEKSKGKDVEKGCRLQQKEGDRNGKSYREYGVQEYRRFLLRTFRSISSRKLNSLVEQTALCDFATLLLLKGKEPL